MAKTKGDVTPEKTPKKKSSNLAPPWRPGQSGNPAGRPKGARAILSENFCQAVMEDFEKSGADAIRVMREEKPGDYAKMIAGMLPKDIDATIVGDLSPELKKWLGTG